LQNNNVDIILIYKEGTRKQRCKYHLRVLFKTKIHTYSSGTALPVNTSITLKSTRLQLERVLDVYFRTHLPASKIQFNTDIVSKILISSLIDNSLVISQHKKFMNYIKFSLHIALDIALPKDLRTLLHYSHGDQIN